MRTGSLENAVEHLTKLERTRHTYAEKIKSVLNTGVIKDLKNTEGGTLIKNVAKETLHCTISGIDSGFSSQNVLGAQIVLIKTAGVTFWYEHGKLKRSDCTMESPAEPLQLVVGEYGEAHEEHLSKNLIRLSKELSMAKKVIKKHRPDYCVLNGSLVLQHADKPMQGSELEKNYTTIVKQFQELYEMAEQHCCVLIGCIEQSRGARFMELMTEHGIIKADSNYQDVYVLEHVLKKGQRTAAFSYSSQPEQHAVLRDFNKRWTEAMYVLYLKSSKYDLPIRVEFLHTQGRLSAKADKVASVVYAMSCMNDSYAYPAVLIEADLRARLVGREANVVLSQLLSKLGPRIGLLVKRSRRPF